MDPFTLEIAQDALIAITDEMFITTQRTSQSTIIYEVLDFAVGLTDAYGRLISQGNGVTLFLGTLGDAVRAILGKFGAIGDIRRGDIYITNDPYHGGGTHLSDVSVVMPAFDGERLVAFACNKAHWTEIGGRDAGSVSTETTEVFQEGLQLPCLRIARDGEIDGGLVDLIRVNVRLPENSIGDLYAQMASVRLAVERLDELALRYGWTAVGASVDRMMEQNATVARASVKAMTAGRYEASDVIDRDQHGGPYPIHVTVEIGDGRFRCDFSRSHPTLRSSLNCSRSALESGVRTIFKALVSPDSILNEGIFEPLEIVCPPGTLFTAERPAAVSVYWEAVGRAADLVWKALAEVTPDKTVAGHFVSLCADIIAGQHPETGELFVLIEPNAGGWGAGDNKDGERALVALSDGETYMIPVEVLEVKYGVLVEQYGFNVSGAGAGQWRGGEGVVKDYRITAETALVTGICDRSETPPWGAAGGKPGSCNAITIYREDGTLAHRGGLISARRVTKGDLVRITTATGGGWGNPLEREANAVRDDVGNGFITPEQAQDVYGVIVNPVTDEVVGVTSERRAMREAVRVARS